MVRWRTQWTGGLYCLRKTWNTNYSLRKSLKKHFNEWRNESMKIPKRIKVTFCIHCALVLVITLFATGAYASVDDPLTVVNNLSDFIFGLIRAIGLILLGVRHCADWPVAEISRSVPTGKRGFSHWPGV